MKKMNKTLKANWRNVQVIELECNKDGDHSDYYSESEIDGHRSSENFRVFQPNNKTQIVIDKGSCQLLELTLNNLFNLTAICGNVQSTAWELILDLAIILVVDWRLVGLITESQRIIFFHILKSIKAIWSWRYFKL